MKKAIILLACLALAAPAMAELVHGNRANAPILTPTAVAPLGDVNRDVGPAVYDSIGPGTSGYAALPAAVGVLGWDDYGTNSGVDLTAVKFAGGVTAPGGVLWFEYYTPTGAFATSFGVQLATAGNYIWTITFNSPPFVIPHDGIFQIVANTSYTGVPTTIAGQFFVTSPDGLTVGTNNTTVGGLPGYVYAFGFYVPEPTTLTLLALGGLVLIRRR